jgi:hypothetical protein
MRFTISVRMATLYPPGSAQASDPDQAPISLSVPPLPQDDRQEQPGILFEPFPTCPRFLFDRTTDSDWYARKRIDRDGVS